MIPESQLETWTNQGAVVTAQATHETIRRALNNHNWPAGVTFDDYLQGSYRNSTNIRGDSDVDIVLELTSTFKPDTSALTTEQRSAFNNVTPNAVYDYDEFYDEVVGVLRDRFGTKNVQPGRMAIKVLADAGRIPADVVVAMTHQRYNYFYGLNNQGIVRGITVKNKESGSWIVNYPKNHIQNGFTKNSNTGMRYKPAVRMMKNARQRAIANGLFQRNIAASYFIESLMYNVQDAVFDNSLREIYLEALETAWSPSRLQFRCQNQINDFFGTGSDQWRTDYADLFASGMYRLWKEW